MLEMVKKWLGKKEEDIIERNFHYGSTSIDKYFNGLVSNPEYSVYDYVKCTLHTVSYNGEKAHTFCYIDPTNGKYLYSDIIGTKDASKELYVWLFEMGYSPIEKENQGVINVEVTNLFEHINSNTTVVLPMFCFGELIKDKNKLYVKGK